MGKNERNPKPWGKPIYTNLRYDGWESEGSNRFYYKTEFIVRENVDCVVLYYEMVFQSNALF